MMNSPYTLRLGITWSLFLLFQLVILLPGFCTNDEMLEGHKYIEQLQSKLLQTFIPPQGGWDKSDGAAEATLTCDGKLQYIYC